MALINSDANVDLVEYKRKQQVMGTINGLLADENGAIALYTKVISSVEEAVNLERRDEIVKRLKEIRTDEIHHMGSLLEIMSLLDSNFTVELNKGIAGE